MSVVIKVCLVIQLSMGVAHDTDITLILSVVIDVGLVIQFSMRLAYMTHINNIDSL